MQEILGRMSVFDCVDIFVFPDDTILNVPVEDWPICDCLISFYSKGFPLEKAIEYAKLRKPFSLNDLEMQYALMDRFVDPQLSFIKQSFQDLIIICETKILNIISKKLPNLKITVLGHGVCDLKSPDSVL